MRPGRVSALWVGESEGDLIMEQQSARRWAARTRPGHWAPGRALLAMVTMAVLMAATLLVSAGPASAALPTAPTGVTATAGNGQASVSWTPGAGSGPPPTDSYTVTSS